MNTVEDPAAAAIATALENVGPRLRLLRKQRRITLTDLASDTGISKSTLSRLENGPLWSSSWRSRTPTECRWTTSWRHPKRATLASG